MTVNRTTVGGIAGLLAAGLLAAGVTPAAAAPPAVPDGRCVISTTDRDRTVDSLLNHCTSQQILNLFAAAPLGVTPVGRKRLALLPVTHTGARLAPYTLARTITRAQNQLGDGLTFGKGPQGQPWVYKNYFFGPDIGAPLKLGVSTWDRKPAWTADFRADFLGVPISVHEYRQLTPAVWIARDTGGIEKDPHAAKHSGGAMAIG